MFRFFSFAMALLAAGTVCVTAGARKITPNEKSPAASTSMKFGTHDVLLEYSAPSARTRKVEGGLIPYGQVWRAGADSATTLSSDIDLMIGDLRVPKGVHTIYILAGENGWKLIVNNQTGQWGTEYHEDQDLGRTPLKVASLRTAPVETLKYDLHATDPHSGMLTMTWCSTLATVRVTPAE